MTLALGWASAATAKPAAYHAPVKVAPKPVHAVAHAAGHKIA